MNRLRAELLERINKKLSKPSVQKEFIDSYLDVALKNPNSYAAQRMIDIILPVDTVEQIDELEASKATEDVSLQKFRIYGSLYDKQKQVIDCIGQNRNILVLNSRRTGKSVTDGAIICWAALEPNTPILYMNITFKQALNQILPEVERFSGVSGLKIVKEDKSEGFVKFENGSICWIGSNMNKASADKWRGFKFKTVIIDEIGHMSNLDYLLDEVLIPAQTDYERPTLIMTGTPSRVPHHFTTSMFEDETNNVKKFNWSMLDNPFLPNPRAAIKEVCDRKGITEDDPFIQREYYGKLVADTEALVIPKRTYFSGESVTKADGVIIGVDYGYRDNNAIVAVGYNKKQHKAFVLHEEKFNKAPVTEVMDKIQECFNSMKKTAKDVVIYADTNEESITADLRTKRKLPAFNCYKYDKKYAIELLREVCANGTLTIAKDGILDREMEQTLYKRDPDTDDIIAEIDDQVFHPDAFYGLLYAMRRVFHELEYEEIKWKESEEEAMWYVNEEGSRVWSNDINGNTTDAESEVILL